MPFCKLRLAGRRPRALPRGYPHEPRTPGERIRQRRMDRGLTQRTLAERLRCCLETVAAWEQDESEPLARQWPGIAEVLGPGLVPQADGFPGRVRALRLGLGLTQEQVAARSGVDLRTIRNVETGRHRPRRRTLARLAVVLESAMSSEL